MLCVPKLATGTLPVAVFQIVVRYAVGFLLGISIANIGLSLLVFFVLAVYALKWKTRRG